MIINRINKMLIKSIECLLLIEPQMYIIYLSLLLLLITPYESKTSKVSKLKGIYRIGPHSKDILSIIFGSLLGDAHAEKGLLISGTIITFFQEGSHIQYILYLHKLFSDFGYCSPNVPSITTRLGTKGKVRKVVRFST
jgi:ubiquinol-cytochrome c reductase cytochrome b subunit